MMTTAPRGGYGKSYSGEARLFVRGLARESGVARANRSGRSDSHLRISGRTNTCRREGLGIRSI